MPLASLRVTGAGTRSEVWHSEGVSDPLKYTHLHSDYAVLQVGCDCLLRVYFPDRIFGD